MALGEKIQQLRKKNHYSQEQMADRLSVSRQAVSKWELNDSVPDLEHAIAISQLFQVSLDELLKDSEGKPKSGQAADKKDNYQIRRSMIIGLLSMTIVLIVSPVLFGDGVVFETLWSALNVMMLIFILVGLFFIGRLVYHFVALKK